MSEKRFDPSEKRLDDARQRGQVVVSRDLVRCARVLLLGELAFALFDSVRDRILDMFRLGLMPMQGSFADSLHGVLGVAGTLYACVMALFALCIVVAAVLASWGQFGVLFAVEAVVPSFDRLNPANAVKQLFSGKKLIEIALSMVKMVLIGGLCYLLIHAALPDIVQLSGGGPRDMFNSFIKLLRRMFELGLVLCVVLGIIDYFVQKQGLMKSLRMSIDELVREHKEMEGDPLIKGMRRSLAFQLLNSAPVKATEKANAVVVNPTHFAVALFYDPAGAPVPQVRAKGRDHIAQAIIARAHECGIPVIRHVWLARTLYATAQEDEPIPRATFDAAALLYVVVEELKAMPHTREIHALDDTGLPPVWVN